jgi:uncharacterized membrane protein YidH (DUF202 family)
LPREMIAMSAFTESGASSVKPDHSRGIPAVSGETRRQVSGRYARRVLLPGVLAVLLVPVFGPLDWLYHDVVFQLAPDYETAESVSNGLPVVELVTGGVLYVMALVSTVRLGRRHSEDRRQHVANGSKAWHAGSIVLIVVLTLIPVVLVLSLLALAMALSALNSGL